MGSTSLSPPPGLAPFDIFIIGGGINGAGIARDAAGRGLKVILCEQHDLANHTSSKSTKLIHGGLRYLEYGEFRLVREALREREILLAIAPHISNALRFILPQTPDARPAWMIRMGLFLYDWLGGNISLPRSESMEFAETIFGRPLKAGITRGFAYSDAWVDDARLVVLNALDAAEHGATILTRTRVCSARRVDGLWQMEVSQGNSAPKTFWARTLVNAAGPWVDRIDGTGASENANAGVRLIKGSHVVTRKLYEGEHAYILQNFDKRVLFAIPYLGKFTLIGTTDIPFAGNPANVEISPEETLYLCAGINRFFKQQIGPEDVVWSYAGVRPLYDDKVSNVSAVTRDYVLDLTSGTHGEAPMLAIYGGKITTYRRLAENALAKLQPYLPEQDIGAWTGTKALPGGDLSPQAVREGLSRRYPDMKPELLARLERSYGSRAFKVLGDARNLDDLGRTFGAGITEAEVEYLVVNEWAREADDVLWRRTKLGIQMTAVEQAEFREWFSKRSSNKAA